jgi:hypothetical protein
MDWRKAELRALYVPLLVYWAIAGFYELLVALRIPAVERYRLNDWQGGKGRRPNAVGKWHVFFRVVLQHVLQVALGVAVLLADPATCHKPPHSAMRGVVNWLLAMFVMDAWQVRCAVHTGGCFFLST